MSSLDSLHFGNGSPGRPGVYRTGPLGACLLLLAVLLESAAPRSLSDLG